MIKTFEAMSKFANVPLNSSAQALNLYQFKYTR
jgi:hypothetical protein